MHTELSLPSWGKHPPARALAVRGVAIVCVVSGLAWLLAEFRTGRIERLLSGATEVAVEMNSDRELLESMLVEDADDIAAVLRWLERCEDAPGAAAPYEVDEVRLTYRSESDAVLLDGPGLGMDEVVYSTRELRELLDRARQRLR